MLQHQAAPKLNRDARKDLEAPTSSLICWYYVVRSSSRSSPFASLATTCQETGELVFIEMGDCPHGELPNKLKTALAHLKVPRFVFPCIARVQLCTFDKFRLVSAPLCTGSGCHNRDSNTNRQMQNIQGGVRLTQYGEDNNSTTKPDLNRTRVLANAPTPQPDERSHRVQ